MDTTCWWLLQKNIGLNKLKILTHTHDISVQAWISAWLLYGVQTNSRTFDVCYFVCFLLTLEIMFV